MRLNLNYLRLSCLILATVLLAGLACQQAKPVGRTWYQMPETKVKTRWYTFENREGLKGQGGQVNFGRKGSPCTGFPAGSRLTLAKINESGTIHRIWMTLWHRNAQTLRGIKVEMYWDGAKTPAVRAPLGDFFGHSMGHMVAFENACF